MWSNCKWRKVYRRIHPTRNWYTRIYCRTLRGRNFIFCWFWETIWLNRTYIYICRSWIIWIRSTVYSMGKNVLKNAESYVMNNGPSTGYFSLKRGTRQGDPLSASLILCVETLLIQITENPDIKGIRIATEEIRLSAYADDADFLTPDVKSLELIFQTCETFQFFWSLKLKPRKVRGLLDWGKKRIKRNPNKL